MIEHRYAVVYDGDDDGDWFSSLELAESNIARIRRQNGPDKLASMYEPMTIRHYRRDVSEWTEVTP